MGEPRRVRVVGDLFHGRVPVGAVYIGRQAPGLPANPWHNPYSVRQFGRDRALELYRRHLARHPEIVELARVELAGKDLACWCRADDPCHGDVLLAAMRGEAPGACPASPLTAAQPLPGVPASPAVSQALTDPHSAASRL